MYYWCHHAWDVFVLVLVLVLVLEGSHPKCVSKPGLVRPMTKPGRMFVDHAQILEHEDELEHDCA
jgi:hypothetical protein